MQKVFLVGISIGLIMMGSKYVPWDIFRHLKFEFLFIFLWIWKLFSILRVNVRIPHV